MRRTICGRVRRRHSISFGRASIDEYHRLTGSDIHDKCNLSLRILSQKQLRAATSDVNADYTIKSIWLASEYKRESMPKSLWLMKNEHRSGCQNFVVWIEHSEHYEFKATFSSTENIKINVIELDDNGYQGLTKLVTSSHA